MNESYVGSSLMIKIRDECSKREHNWVHKGQENVNNKKQVIFSLAYEQGENPQIIRRNEIVENLNQLSKIKLKDRSIQLPKMLPSKKDSKLNLDESHLNPRKISVNFDFFNPKKKNRQEVYDSRLENFEEIIKLSKEKYLCKIEKQNRKRSQRFRMLSKFGLNIKTVEPSEDCDRFPKGNTLKLKQTFYKNTAVTRNDSTQTACNLKPGRNISQYRNVTNTRQKSKSLVVETINHCSYSQKLNVKGKIKKMIRSHNLALMSFECYIDKNFPFRESKLKYYVGNGNNKNLVISILKKRWWWIETNEVSLANLVWTQLKHKSTLDRLQLYDGVPMPLVDANFVQQLPKQSKYNDLFKLKVGFFHQQFIDRFQNHLFQNDKKMMLKPLKIPECVHNHFSHNFMFGNKNALFENLSEYFSYKKQDVYSIIPLTFFVESCSSKRFEQFERRVPANKNSIWIVKPAQNSNRGNGIYVANSVQEIKERMNRKKAKHTYIIQKYITNLLLYQKRKFDIRTYILMVSIKGVTKFFWYNEGYIRTSSEIFDLTKLSDSFIHLTNDAIQIKGSSYGKFEQGNKISYSQFQHYLDYNFPDENLSIKSLHQIMKKIATLAVKATYNKLDPQPKAFGFELFGLDFIIDSDFKPWLIEINTNPCLQLSSPVLERLIPRMLQNVFRITVDPVFQPTEQASRSRSYYLYENCLEKNQFQLIFDSLFDCDLSWQEYSKCQRQKTYEEDNVVFESDGVEIAADY